MTFWPTLFLFKMSIKNIKYEMGKEKRNKSLLNRGSNCRFDPKTGIKYYKTKEVLNN